MVEEDAEPRGRCLRDWIMLASILTRWLIRDGLLGKVVRPLGDIVFSCVGFSFSFSLLLLFCELE